jgi:hypothetical protein
MVLILLSEGNRRSWHVPRVLGVAVAGLTVWLAQDESASDWVRSAGGV